MEVYILDSLYRRVGVLDRYESFIWTERFSDIGDFEFKLHSTRQNQARLPIGLRLAINESARVMEIETVEDSTDSDGKATLTLKGRSFEKVMQNRLARSALSDLTSTPKWTITDQPADIARKLFHDICVTGVLNAGDIIPGIFETSIFPADTIPEPTDTVTYSIDPMSLYQAIKDLCDIYSMGFRLVKNLDTSHLHFDIYMGSDRTSGQTALPAVIFSPDFDNLKNTTRLSTTMLYKNVAYVISPVGNRIVYDEDIPSTVGGFDRNVLFVKADDITDVITADANAKMDQRGRQELAKARKITAFDGEISQVSQYKYGRDYNLGDLVELRSEDGSTSNMQVTEQIFVSDHEGVRSYPTLAVNSFVVEGSWNDTTPDLVWNSVGSTVHWNDL